MIRIRCIRVLDSQYTHIAVEYPYDLRFDEASLVVRFRDRYKNLYTELTGELVTVDIDYVDIPKKVDPVKICQLTASEMGINMDALFGKTRHPDVVLARISQLSSIYYAITDGGSDFLFSGKFLKRYI